MTYPGPVRDDEREPTQPIELEDVEPAADRPLRSAAHSHSAPPPLPPAVRAARPTGSMPPPLPPVPEGRASGVHRVERAAPSSPPAAASLTPALRPAGLGLPLAKGLGAPPPAAGSLPPPPAAGSLPPPPAAPVLPVSKISSVPPPLPPVAKAMSSPPPPPPVTKAVSVPPRASSAEAAPELRALQDELREVTAHRDRLRLRTLRQDERIEQLQAELAAQVAEVGRLGQALALAQTSATAELTDLKRVQGIGPAFERALKQQGVTSLEMIAAWSPEEAVEMARRIGTTPHRIQRDGWVRSARELLGLPTND